MRPRLLDMYCGAGGASMGYHRAGFDVTGVDIEPQRNYPFEFIQADAMEALADHAFLSRFDAIHASPPCQAHSRARHSWGREYESVVLLGSTIDALRGQPLPWVVENVEGAVMADAFTLCGTSFGLGIHRHRRFLCTIEMLAPPCDPSRIRYRGRAAEVFGHHGNTARVREEWGMPWATQAGLAQAIPPAFTEYIGAELLDHLKERAA